MSVVQDGIAAIKENKRVYISFGSLPVDTQQAVELFSALENNTALQNLDVSGCKIRGLLPFEALSASLRRNKCLTELNLENNSLTEEGAQRLCEALDDNDTLVAIHLELNPVSADMKDMIATKTMLNTQPPALKRGLPRIKLNDPTMTRLTLCDSDVAEFDKTFQILAEELKSNKHLGEFYLSNCKMDDHDASVIADMLRYNRSITTLDISKNSIGSRGGKHLAEALLENVTLVELNMHGNKIGHVIADFTAMLKTNNTLKEVNLIDNGIPQRNYDTFSQALQLNRDCLTLKQAYYTSLDNDPDVLIIDLGYAALTKDGWIKHCADLLSKPLCLNTHVKQVNFANCKIGDEGCEHLAVVIAGNRSIDDLNLPNNNITSTGCNTLGKALANNQTLRDINLANNRIYDAGLQGFERSLEINNSLISLNTENNYVSTEMTDTILSLLSLNLQPVELKQALPLIAANSDVVAELDFSKQDGERFHTSDSAALLGKALKTSLSVTSINLEGQTLGAQGAIHIANALSSNKSVKYLNVADNSILDKGALAIAKMIRANIALLTINLENNSLHDESAQALCKAFEINNKLVEMRVRRNKISSQLLNDIEQQCHVNTLPASLKQVQPRLRGNDDTLASVDFSCYDGARYYDDEAVKLLATDMKSVNSIINLNLSNNTFGAAGAQAIAEVVHNNSSITELELANNKIGDDGATALADALRANTTITKVNLENCGIGNNGLRAIVECLQQENDSVQELILGRSGYRLDPELLQGLADALEMNAQPKRFKEWEPKLYENNPSLTLLNFSDMRWNEKLNDVSMQILSNALKKNDYIKTLNIANNKITQVGASHLSSMLRKNKALTEINLTNNKILDTGARAIIRALDQNDTLRYLHVKNNDITQNVYSELEKAMLLNTVPNVLKRLVNKLRSNDRNITELEFCGVDLPNKFDNFAVQVMCDCLKKNTVVKRIDLSWNKIGRQGVMELANLLRGNNTIHTLLLDGNRLEAEGGQALVAALKGNIALQRLSIQDCEVPKEVTEGIEAVLKINTVVEEPRTGLKRPKAYEDRHTNEFKTIEYFDELERDILSDALADRSYGMPAGYSQRLGYKGKQAMV